MPTVLPSALPVSDRAKYLRWTPNDTPEILIKRASEARLVIGEDLYTFGELLIRIKETQAWKSIPGMKSFEHWLRDFKIAGRSTAFKLMAIVAGSPREAGLLKQGIEFAYGMIRFSTLKDELLALGVDPKVMEAFEVEKMTSRQREELCRQLALAIQGKLEPVTPTPTPPKPGRRIKKTPEAVATEKRLRKGRKDSLLRAMSFRKNGELWMRITLPQSEARFLALAV